MASEAKHIGLYFGSFNPIHNGHLAIAAYLLKTEKLDEVWFVVSPQSPFKTQEFLLDDEYRYSMVLLAVKGNSRLHACNIEFSMARPSYTIDTLQVLRAKYPSHKFSVIMGADNLESFHKWKKYNEIIGNYKVFVYPRKDTGIKVPASYPNITVIDAPLLDISSTDIRSLIREGKDIQDYVPQQVYEYIKKMGFYR